MAICLKRKERKKGVFSGKKIEGVEQRVQKESMAAVPAMYDATQFWLEIPSDDTFGQHFRSFTLTNTMIRKNLQAAVTDSKGALKGDNFNVHVLPSRVQFQTTDVPQVRVPLPLSC